SPIRGLQQVLVGDHRLPQTQRVVHDLAPDALVVAVAKAGLDVVGAALHNELADGLAVYGILFYLEFGEFTAKASAVHMDDLVTFVVVTLRTRKPLGDMLRKDLFPHGSFPERMRVSGVRPQSCFGHLCLRSSCDL